MMQKQSFSIQNMHCSNCVLQIEGLEDDLPGVHRVSVSYQQGKADFEFDETLLNPTVIIAAIEKLGFRAQISRS